MKYRALILKNSIENVLIFPFVAIGYLLYLVSKKDRSYETFFFFPFYHTGGAEKVHVQIATAVGNSNCIIFFTRKSAGTNFYEGFKKTNCYLRNISRFTDNKYLYFLNLVYRGFLAATINHQETSPIVFNGQCNFAYKISPWLRKEVVQIELIHALNTFSYIRIPFIQHYTKCLTVSQEIIDKHQALNRKKLVPKNLADKFSFIETRIELPPVTRPKDYNGSPLQVLYVGRSTPEKRVHIVAQIAERLTNENLAVQFNFAGDVRDAVSPGLHRYCNFYGDIADEDKLDEVYHHNHILVVSSETESGPLVIMEAMARGLVIVTTEVGFVARYLTNGVNGCKVDPLLGEDTIVMEMAAFIKDACGNRNKLALMGAGNLKLAYQRFGLAGFVYSYQELFRSLRK